MKTFLSSLCVSATLREIFFLSTETGSQRNSTCRMRHRCYKWDSGGADSPIGPKPWRARRDAPEPQGRLRPPDPLAPAPETGGWERTDHRGEVRTEPVVRGEHPQRAVPEGVCGQPPGREGRLRPGPTGPHDQSGGVARIHRGRLPADPVQ